MFSVCDAVSETTPNQPETEKAGQLVAVGSQEIFR
jgi:hypothetical protein